MFKHYFERIENVEAGPLVTLVFFFLFFVVMVVWIFKLDRKFINKMKNLPLDEENIKSDKE